MNLHRVYTIGIIALTAGLCLPLAAMAQDAQSGIADAGGVLTNWFGNEVGSIAEGLALLFVPIINSVAALAIVASAIAMAFSQSEEHATTARRTIIGSVVAIMLVNATNAIRSGFFGSSYVSIGSGGISFESGLSVEILGVARWLTSAAATVAVLMIIVSGIRAVITWGSEEGLAQLRRTVISVVAGFTLIGVRLIIAESITETGSPGGITSEIVRAMNIVVGFMGLFAVIMIVIAGIMMVVNIGDDNQYGRAKSLIIRVVIGLLVILASAGIVNVIYNAV